MCGGLCILGGGTLRADGAGETIVRCPAAAAYSSPYHMHHCITSASSSAIYHLMCMHDDVQLLTAIASTSSLLKTDFQVPSPSTLSHTPPHPTPCASLYMLVVCCCVHCRVCWIGLLLRRLWLLAATPAHTYSHTYHSSSRSSSSRL